MPHSPMDLLYRPLRDLQAHLKEELARNPFLELMEPRFTSREHALSAPAEQLGVDLKHISAEVWLAVVETGYPETVVTLMALADGTTRLYFDDRRGVIGAGERPDVAEASRQVLAVAAQSVYECAPVDVTPRPELGRVAFYLRTRDGMLGAQATASDLMADRHPLSALYRTAVSVLAAIRGESA